MKSVRRGIAGIAAAALTATGLSVLTVATAPIAHAEDTAIDQATLVWGINGYAQKGIFGPWTFKDLSGNVAQLTGSVSNGSQTEYAVDPVPATSMPVSSPQKTPNAVKFTVGTGTADPATGEVDLAWDGSYTVNAYPAMYNAPNEIYSDPELTLDADGDGELTMNFALGAGVDMEGNPTAAEDFGRLTLLTFSDGSVVDGDYGRFRATPDYQGVQVTVPEGSAQVSTCTTDGGATGWWGSWPQEFVNAIPSSVRPHFYSTGCGGMQDAKPALPVDVDLGIEEPAPEQATVTVEQTDFLPTGAHQVTVTGTGFVPALATGSRPPLSGKPSGTYVVFGKFAADWKPSAGAAGSTRVNSSQKWAVLAADMATIGGPDGGAIELQPDGTFEAVLTIDKEAIDAKATAETLVNYGVYTYAGSGATQPLYETYTPITFALQDRIDAATALVAADKQAIANVVARYNLLRTEISKARTQYAQTITQYNAAKKLYSSSKGARKAAALKQVKALVAKAAVLKQRVVVWSAQSADLVEKSAAFRAKLVTDQAALDDLVAQSGA